MVLPFLTKLEITAPACLQDASERLTELMCKWTVCQPLGTLPSHLQEPSWCPAEAWSRHLVTFGH